MISFDFDYYRPSSLKEAVDCFYQLSSSGKNPMYYSGGTELLSMARAESIKFDAVIDLKEIPECLKMGTENGNLVLGSELTLTQIVEAGHYPLLCETAARIADHTIQGKITLGGNLAGTIKYREAALPLMLCDCMVHVMTQNGLNELAFKDVFDGRLRLAKGEFLVAFIINQDMVHLPYVHAKKTKMDKIDYPLITLAGHRRENAIQAAVSGLSDTPMPIPNDVLSNTSLSIEERISKVIDQVKDMIVVDSLGSREYRIFVLRNMLSQMFENLKGV